MDQKNVLVENMASGLTPSNYQHPVENSLSRAQDHRSLMPEVSNLITSINQLTSHNFELLKRVPDNQLGPYNKISRFLSEIRFCYVLRH